MGDADLSRRVTIMGKGMQFYVTLSLSKCISLLSLQITVDYRYYDIFPLYFHNTFM